MKNNKFEGTVITNLEFIKEKQTEQSEHLDRIDKKLSEGGEKIAKNREGVKSAHRRINTLDRRFWGIIMAVVVGGAGLLVSVFKKVLR